MRIVEGLVAAREAGDVDAQLRLHAQLWLDGPAAPEGRVGGPARELALAMNRTILRNDVPDDEGEAGVDAWARLEEIAVPTTVMWGDRDVPFGIETCEALADAHPGGAHARPRRRRAPAVARGARRARGGDSGQHVGPLTPAGGDRRPLRVRAETSTPSAVATTVSSTLKPPPDGFQANAWRSTATVLDGRARRGSRASCSPSGRPGGGRATRRPGSRARG